MVEWWTSRSVSSEYELMELSVAVHAGAVGSDRGRGVLKRSVGFSAQAQTGRGLPVDGSCGCAVPQPRQRPLHHPPQSPVTSASTEQGYQAIGDPSQSGERTERGKGLRG